MSKRAILVLNDGSIYEGRSFGPDATTYGEVVFNTVTGGRISLRGGGEIRCVVVERQIPVCLP